MLHDASENCVVIDREALPGVDIVGNVLELATLDQARVHEAGAVILALSNDSESVFSTAEVRDYAPAVPLHCARMTRSLSVAQSAAWIAISGNFRRQR